MAVVTREMESRGWATDSEVSVKTVGGLKPWTADLIVRKDDELRIIEGKLDLSEDLLRQCQRWLPYCHRVFAAVPHPGHCPTAAWIQRRRLFNHSLVGVLLVTQDGRVQSAAGVNPPMRENADIGPVLIALNGPRRPQPAGSPAPMHGARSGRAWERWEPIRRYARENPGCAIRDAIDACGMEKPDRNELVRLAQRKEIEQAAGLRVEGQGKWQLYVCEELES